MPICDKCGSYVSEIETNCRKCGAFIYPNASGANTAPAANVRRKRGIRIIIAATVMICVAVAALFLLASNARTATSNVSLPETQDTTSGSADVPTAGYLISLRHIKRDIHRCPTMLSADFI